MPSRHDRKFYFTLGAREAAIATASIHLVESLFTFFALLMMMGLLNFVYPKDNFLDEDTLKEIQIIMAVSVLYLFINIGCTGLLIKAITKARSNMMLPWLAVTIIGMLSGMMAIFISFKLPETESIMCGFLAALTVTGHTIYKWDVVKCCYYLIKNEETTDQARVPVPNQNNEAAL